MRGSTIHSNSVLVCTSLPALSKPEASLPLPLPPWFRLQPITAYHSLAQACDYPQNTSESLNIYFLLQQSKTLFSEKVHCMAILSKT